MTDPDRRRANVFGEVAHQYDRARPTYPPELVADLMADQPGRVLDVGCGTGIAARLFATAGADVLGVEPDARMADVARSRGSAVEVASFEDWDAGGRTFDLVVSGQAWHWVDPDIGPHKAADALRPRGRLAVFWNLGTHDPTTKAAFDEVYRRLAPELSESYALGMPPVDDGGRNAIDASGRYEPSVVRLYEWDRPYTRDEWLDQLPTHSDHRLIPATQLEDLLAAVGSTVDKLGGSIVGHFQTKVITARRLA